MTTINQERKAKLIYRSYLIVAFLLIIFFGWGLAKEIVNRKQIDKQIADYEEKIAKLKQDNASIQEKMLSWNNSFDLEMAARTKLGLQKPGEKAIFIDRGESNASPSTAIKTNQEIVRLITEGSGSSKNASNPAKWLKKFFQF